MKSVGLGAVSFRKHHRDRLQAPAQRLDAYPQMIPAEQPLSCIGAFVATNDGGNRYRQIPRCAHIVAVSYESELDCT